jgi:hypothetical protein
MAQFLRPDSDVNIGSWTGDPTNSAGNRYQNIDEVTASDTDFVRSENNPSTSNVTFGLSAGSIPGSGTRTLRIRWRMNQSGGGAPSSIGLVTEILQGSTVIQTEESETSGNNVTSWKDKVVIITNSITDYSDIRVRLEVTKTGGRTAWAEVSWIEFEIPDVSDPTKQIQIGGDWKEISDMQVKQSGTWRVISKMYKKISGVWEESQ